MRHADTSAGVSRRAYLLEGRPRSGRKISPANLFEKMIGVDALRELYSRARMRGNLSFFESVLAELEVKTRISDADMARIPSSGPVIVCSNHPFGILDGMVLGATLMRAREDVRILTNLLLQDIAELEPYCFWIDPFANGRAAQNRASIRRAVRWLNQGGMLATFPAGEVSHWNFRERAVADPQWSDTAVRLARMTNAAIVPVHFEGQNSLVFQGLGCVHPRLRTLRLPSELLNKAGAEVTLRIGSPIAIEELSRLEPESIATSHLRARCEVLSSPFAPRVAVAAKQELPPVAPPEPRALVVPEIEQLQATRILAENEEFVVVAAHAAEIPSALQELGRQREIAFRAEGEGSGLPRDLDEFDRHYTHLLLWNKPKQEIAGGYRIGATKEILPRYGAAGLYTTTLFDFDERFFYTMGAGLELGRSFIAPEYQRRFSPLLLLWKAIGQYVSLHPDSPVLFGAVSISAEYRRLSRELIIRYFDECKPGELAELVRPRCPIRFAAIDQRKAAILTSALGDASALSKLVGDIEPDNKSIPILLAQYLKLGGRVLGFNLDRNFSDVVDGLIYVDLRQTPDRALTRYMTATGLRNFRHYHAENVAPYSRSGIELPTIHVSAT
jgi:putative hemolysin